MEVGEGLTSTKSTNIPTTASPIKVALLIYVDFYRIEKKILEEIKFDILAEGVCDRQVKTVLLMLREILTESYYRMLCKITEDMQIMVWHHLFTKG